MTLTQLKYAITVSEAGSMNQAAKELFISQPSLSLAIRDLEEEIGVELFRRSSRGILLTPDGEEFIGYAKQVVEQYQLIESKYVQKEKVKKKFSVSMQHYTFAVNAFVEMVKQFGMDEYEFAVHETKTYEVIEDVRTFRSEIGILYLNEFNRKVLTKLFAEYNLEFHEILRCGVYVYMWKGHPLANKKEIESEVKGEVPFEKPLKRSVDTKTIKKQLLKVDKYPFDIVGVNINYDGTLFIPISEINKIRRELFKKLEKEVYSLYSNKKVKINLENECNALKTDQYSLSYYTNNLTDLDKINNVKRVYLEIPPEDPSVINQSREEYNINYMVSYLQKAIDISRNRDYELIWKWPDIAHDNLIKVLGKVRGILNKLHYPIEIMSPDFTGQYGPYSMNVTNTQTIKSLENYKIITLSPELKKEDLKNILTF